MSKEKKLSKMDFYYPKRLIENKLCHLLSVIELNKGDKAVSDALQEEISQYRNTLAFIESSAEPSIFNKQHRRKVLDWAERWRQNLPFKAYQTLLAILKTTPENEAQAEPSEEGRIRTRGAGWGRGRGGEGITNKEPSEAELGEFAAKKILVEKWADIVTPVVLINNKMRPQLMKAMQKDLINMLKEYNELRRG